MKNSDVIAKVTQVTGMEGEACQVIIKAFEKASENALIERFKGNKKSKEEIVSEVSIATNMNSEDCTRVLDCLNELVEEGSKGRFEFFKKTDNRN